KSIDGAELTIAPLQRLVFPKVNPSTKLSFVNTASAAVRIQAKFYENSGVLFKATEMLIGADAGFSGSPAELDSSALNFEGYAILESPAPNLVGFESYSKTQDIAAFNAMGDSDRLHQGYLPHLASGGGYYSAVGLVNPTDGSLTVRITG